MGRYPFLVYVEKYLEKRKAFIAPSTRREWEKKMKDINRVLVELKEKGMMSTTSPEKMGSADIAAFITWGREKGIQPATMVKYVGLLENICNCANNPIIERMRAESEKFPTTTPKALEAWTNRS